MTVHSVFDGVGKDARRAASGLVLALVCLIVSIGAAVAQQNEFANEPVTITAEDYNGFGRLIITFTERLDLPDYEVGWENGVLVVKFQQPVRATVRDLAEKLPNYVTAARMDPDKTGIRIGLKDEFRLNKTEAGEALYVDLLPLNWQGIEPGLPRAVVEELSRRSKEAAIRADQVRRAAFVRENNPQARLSVGRHPTFMRLLINWDIDAQADFAFEAQAGTLDFDWPVPIDLADLQSQLPPEIVAISNEVDEAGTHITFRTAPEVEPRFYENSRREFVIDFDALNPMDTAVDLSTLLEDQIAASGELGDPLVALENDRDLQVNVPAEGEELQINPYVEQVGSTVRLVFPFEQDTAAAVFRRANTLWMVFDSYAIIGKPEDEDALAEIASEFTVVPAGGTSIVRMNLDTNRLATLGSEGRAWVLSLGDDLLTPGEVINLSRRQTQNGQFEMIADMDRPYQVHEVRDPDVGDVLEVVTAFPPARGIVRELEHVDFVAMRSVHGLVIQPLNDSLRVDIEARTAVIGAPRGLVLSTPQLVRSAENSEQDASLNGFVDLTAQVERNPRIFNERLLDLMQLASEAEQRELDAVRFDIAKLYFANQLSFEALGVLDILDSERVGDALEDDVAILKAAASTMAGRSDDAVQLLTGETLAGKPDAAMWRTIARAEARDFAGARSDALAAELSIDAYPDWVRERFLLSATEAALEESDLALANRFLGMVEMGQLQPEERTTYELLAARIDQSAGRIEEALDTYGRVITEDIRPTRAEAIYRTMMLLDEIGRLDPVRAADTLASEVLVWRGDDLEADMLQLLSRLYFRNRNYRDAFDTVKLLANSHPESEATGEVLNTAKDIFAGLYLNGQADAMAPVDALTLYYDYRNFTPAGARGDEMVRNLARRLISVDLLEQAGELLQYQVDNRLEGAARAQIAADLAVVYLAERMPEKALVALNETRFAGITPGLERQRRVLEARALIDAGREDLAIDILSQIDGRDADLLRVDAHWRAKRYQDAGETLERLYASELRSGPLSQSARMNVVKAAVGFVLANDRLGVTRLRERFADALSQTPEWPLFDFVTGEVEVTSLEFRRVAEQIADTDSLNAFLATYRDIYGTEGALAPRQNLDA